MNENLSETNQSKLKTALYGFGNFFNEFFTMTFGSFAFFFYETEIGLNVWLTGSAFVIFALWNAVNDPLVGYLTNKPFKFTKKWGRRFPWILIGGIPYVASYILIFTPPTTDATVGALPLFIWLIFTTCLYDFFASIYWVNFSSLFPDKFRTVDERRTASGLQIPIGIFGVALGAIIPPLIIKDNNLQSYVIAAFVVFLIGLSALLLSIPGIREDQKTIERYLKRLEAKEKRPPFIESFKYIITQRAFIAFVIIYTLYQAVISLMTASIPYAVIYLLEMPISASTLIFAGFLIGALISIPIWIKFVKKSDSNKLVLFVAAILLGIFTSPMLFIRDYILMIIAMIFWGISLGGFWVMIAPTLADVIDNSVVKTGRREEGIITGLQRFFARIAIVIQALSFAIAHSLTGFVEGSDVQTELAKWGIHIHLALIPIICIFIGAFIFWIFYNLTPDKVKENQKKIAERGL
ncbi:MAG: Na+/melibiose symporter-like transporter [Promethearchaeota archaeon]|nr:MAG: Na+/melibiose symporter-like transporter [Candidatus Lokiarchaeota archaeon]